MNDTKVGGFKPIICDICYRRILISNILNICGYICANHVIMKIFDLLIDNIAEHSYGVTDDFFTPEEVKALVVILTKRHDAGIFKKAGIGQKTEQQVQTQIRGDQILWLNENSVDATEQAFFLKINDFIKYLNLTCYLGLRGFEFHYALYPIGTFYKRHFDRFRHDSGRKMSVICYLNGNWQATDGGELGIHLPNQQSVKIAPLGGRLVCFEADKLEHEVLPALRERLSLTGWLRTD
jgi:SM-20-related protein